MQSELNGNDDESNARETLKGKRNKKERSESDSKGKALTNHRQIYHRVPSMMTRNTQFLQSEYDNAFTEELRRFQSSVKENK